MTSKLLLTDITSSLGRAILSALELSSHTVILPAYNEVDWTDGAAIDSYLDRVKPDIVINTSGWSEVLAKPAQNELVAVANALSSACHKADLVVIHFSSFRVFGGENKSSYDEQDPALPLGAAGRSFDLSERAFAKLSKRICVRLGWLLDVDGDSLFHRLLEDLSSDGQALELCGQFRGNPVSLARVGSLIAAMVNQVVCGAENWGVFHFGSGDNCSLVELSDAVAEILRREDRLPRELEVVDLSDTEIEQLEEPLCGVLAMERCRDDFGVQASSWRSGLTPLVQHWLAQSKAN